MDEISGLVKNLNICSEYEKRASPSIGASQRGFHVVHHADAAADAAMAESAPDGPTDGDARLFCPR